MRYLWLKPKTQKKTDVFESKMHQCTYACCCYRLSCMKGPNNAFTGFKARRKALFTFFEAKRQEERYN